MTSSYTAPLASAPSSLRLRMRQRAGPTCICKTWRRFSRQIAAPTLSARCAFRHCPLRDYHTTHHLYESHQHDLHTLNLHAIRLIPQARAFRHCPTKFGSYTNGKSFAKLDAIGLRAHGPHHFRSVDGAGMCQTCLNYRDKHALITGSIWLVMAASPCRPNHSMPLLLQ